MCICALSPDVGLLWPWTPLRVIWEWIDCSRGSSRPSANWVLSCSSSKSYMGRRNASNLAMSSSNINLMCKTHDSRLDTMVRDNDGRGRQEVQRCVSWFDWLWWQWRVQSYCWSPPGAGEWGMPQRECLWGTIFMLTTDLMSSLLAVVNWFREASHPMFLAMSTTSLVNHLKATLPSSCSRCFAMGWCNLVLVLGTLKGMQSWSQHSNWNGQTKELVVGQKGSFGWGAWAEGVSTKFWCGQSSTGIL